MTEVKNPDVEEWESVVAGLRGIVIWDDKGEWSVDDVEGGGTFYITPENRRRQARMCKDQADNPFTNGAFRMVAAVDGDANSQSLLDENKVPDEDDLELLLDMSWAPFAKGVAAIDEPLTLERLYRLARKNEVGGKKFKTITDRLKAVDPDAVVVGDKLGEGRENPDDQREGPVMAVELDQESRPREYAGIDD